MTNSDKVLVVANAAALAVTGGWVYSRPGWDSWAAFALALAVLVGILVKVQRAATANHRETTEMGKGGAAIRMGKGGKLAIENQGDIRAGKGGTGGDGGDAILVGDGLDITIVNNGVIAGGDAGVAGRWPAVPAFIEKQVHFRYPVESGLQPKLEAEGFRVAWCNRSRVEKLLAEGWELVELHHAYDGPIRFCLKNSVGEDQLLMKQKQ